MRAHKLLVAMATTLTLVMVSTPASAQTRVWNDAVGDTSRDGLADIGAVTVSNTNKATTVTVRIPREQPEKMAFAETRVYLDTNKKKSGPEYLWLVSYPGEAFFAPVKRNKIQSKKAWYDVAQTTKCAKTVRETFSPADGIFRIKIKHKAGCLGNPKAVRTNIRTVVSGWFNYDGDGSNYAQPEYDYYPSRSGYTPSVAR